MDPSSLTAAALLAAFLAAALSPAGSVSPGREALSAPANLAGAATSPAPPPGVRRTRPGTPKAILSHAGDSLRKVYEVMRIASVGASERRKILIVLREDTDEDRPEGVEAGEGPAGGKSRDIPGRKRIRLGISGIDGMTMEKLLSRVDRFVSTDGPVLLSKTSGDGKVFRETARRLRRLVLAAAQTGIGPTEKDRALIRDSLLDLAGQLEELERAAPGRVSRPGE